MTKCRQIIGMLLLSFMILGNHAFAAYDGTLLQKTDLGIYKIDEVQDTTYILEHPCSNIDSIKFRFPKQLFGQELKITGTDLGQNPTKIDIPGLEYRFCNISMLLNDKPIFEDEDLPDEEMEFDLSYLMTVDYSVDKEWINENGIDKYRINLFTFLRNQKTWQDVPGAELFETEKRHTFTSTTEDDRPNITLVTTGDAPEDSMLHHTGKNSNLALMVTILLATLIYFLPKWT